jgi:hypothetical protein
MAPEHVAQAVARARFRAHPAEVTEQQPAKPVRSGHRTPRFVLRRAPHELPVVQLVQLPFHADCLRANVLRFEPDQLAPPHAGEPVGNNGDELVVTAGEQGDPLGQQQHPQRRGNDFLRAAIAPPARTLAAPLPPGGDVLFSGQDALEQVFLAGLAGSTATGTMTLVAAALQGAGAFFTDDRRSWSRARQQVIDAHEAFRERELLKLSALAESLTAALRSRGADPATAALAAQTGMAVFRTAFAAWIAEGEQRPFAEIQQSMLARLRDLTADQALLRTH